MVKLLAIYGSPRRKGNTAMLLHQAAKGARECGAQVEEVVLRDLKMSPCLEIYSCKNTGRCVIQDDFQKVYDQILSSHGILLASPVFFYAVSAHTKILMDRCQSLWVRKYWLKDVLPEAIPTKRKGLFISVGATKGRKLFDGSLLTVRYYFESIDCELWRSLLYRSLDFEGDVLTHPEYLEEAYRAGRELCEAVS
jgi:multimeric flavodoxin WrbA